MVFGALRPRFRSSGSQRVQFVPWFLTPAAPRPRSRVAAPEGPECSKMVRSGEWTIEIGFSRLYKAPNSRCGSPACPYITPLVPTAQYPPPPARTSNRETMEVPLPSESRPCGRDSQTNRNVVPQSSVSRTRVPLHGSQDLAPKIKFPAPPACCLHGHLYQGNNGTDFLCSFCNRIQARGYHQVRYL